MEFWELTRFKAAARRLFHANLRSVRAQAISSPLMDIIGSVAIALLLLVGRTEIRDGALSEPAFFVFIVAVFKLYDPVRKFALFYNSFQQALGASGNIFEFMDEQDSVRDRPHAKSVKGFRNEIRFENVRFSYTSDEGEKEVLSGINLTVPRGEVVAFVGPSGAGKTTLVNLIPRFFDVTGGRLLVDGQDVRDLKTDSLRRLIGNVTQETILFNDTVRNNIAYGQPDVPMEKVEEAARVALAHDFISAMPEGYDTVIGEKGFRLSGGERQRLAIARALFKNAPILILDEATSSLDTESESLVQAALSNLMLGRTVFVIAHRLSTVRRATRIAVVEAGQITAVASHDELLHTSPMYQRLYQLQFADDADGTPEPAIASGAKV
jgi:subfamily B ATP-binding cassette protein MsbA